MISVDGEDYRWLFSADSDFFTIVVQIEDGTGSRLEATSSFDWRDYSGVQISSGLVAKLIRLAISDGWNPRVGGTTFKIADFDHRVEVRRGST